ncbi:hypothetical protein PUN28_002049 [Cardiocondyla obscurior]|uniref:Uncharacterized protein n=1 Tax=Cardiocondyla obscurior TaxID=286306 RepID=A0AAW2GSB9_9HYME
MEHSFLKSEQIHKVHFVQDSRWNAANLVSKIENYILTVNLWHFGSRCLLKIRIISIKSRPGTSSGIIVVKNVILGENRRSVSIDKRIRIMRIPFGPRFEVQMSNDWIVARKMLIFQQISREKYKWLYSFYAIHRSAQYLGQSNLPDLLQLTGSKAAFAVRIFVPESIAAADNSVDILLCNLKKTTCRDVRAGCSLTRPSPARKQVVDRDPRLHKSVSRFKSDGLRDTSSWTLRRIPSWTFFQIFFRSIIDYRIIVCLHGVVLFMKKVYVLRDIAFHVAQWFRSINFDTRLIQRSGQGSLSKFILRLLLVTSARMKQVGVSKKETSHSDARSNILRGGGGDLGKASCATGATPRVRITLLKHKSSSLS